MLMTLSKVPSLSRKTLVGEASEDDNFKNPKIGKGLYQYSAFLEKDCTFRNLVQLATLSCRHQKVRERNHMVNHAESR